MGGERGTANLVILCATSHRDVLTNTLGLSWRMARRLHGTIGVMTVGLLAFHVVAFLVSRDPFPMTKAANIWAAVVSFVRIDRRPRRLMPLP
jgi:hypothetical protein